MVLQKFVKNFVDRTMVNEDILCRMPRKRTHARYQKEAVEIPRKCGQKYLEDLTLTRHIEDKNKGRKTKRKTMSCDCVNS